MIIEQGHCYFSITEPSTDKPFINFTLVHPSFENEGHYFPAESVGVLLSDVSVIKNMADTLIKFADKLEEVKNQF